MAHRSPTRILASVTDARIIPAQQGDPEWTPSHSMNRHVRRARREMGEARWAELNREWL
ncbi:hypothetical protein SAMN05660666_03451 [Novosphingobium aromaticivorans]|uniref:hypothetical protein n=1 Tax=Novosphingobium aromaticivorans TaxID=48935 RepID=UPI000038A694|nr:hypothetical protein [Novosphingobium aromaticivorans]SCY89253.1 hypothetical protein SAMN05660666_03451 [Novosphingobium aromaticivorans]